jgi:NRPS condensation-like uncharacterized protein
VQDESGQIQSDILHFVNTLCDPEKELPLKLLLLHSVDRDILCFKIDHVLADAGGLKSLLYLFAEAYAKRKLAPVVNRNRGFGQVFLRFSPLALFKAARAADLPKPGPALLAGPFDSSSVFLEHACLDPEQFGRVHIAAKQAEATISDALLTALYRAIWDQVGDNLTAPYPVMVPVDMRSYLPAEKRLVIGNMSSASQDADGRIESRADWIERPDPDGCWSATRRTDDSQPVPAGGIAWLTLHQFQ